MEKEIEKLTPMDTVYALCRNCLGVKAMAEEKLKNCEGDTIKCTLYSYRAGNKRISVKTLRKYCLSDCMGDNSSDHVRDCPTSKYQNFPYRFGTNPACSGRESENKGTEALRKYWEGRDRKANN